MKAIDLFSCVGCHAIGFGRAGIETVEFCEINPWRRQRLRELGLGAGIHTDVRKYLYPRKADIVIGGPPCQETSVAAAIHGKRTGASLWPEMLRIVKAAAPQWVVVEQPPGHAAWEDQVYSDLLGIGFEVARFEFGACDVGAPYLRRRVFLVACSSVPRLEIARQTLPRAIEEAKRTANARGDWDPDQLAAIPVDARSAGQIWTDTEITKERQNWIEALGDSNPPGMAEAIGLSILTATIAP